MKARNVSRTRAGKMNRNRKVRSKMRMFFIHLAPILQSRTMLKRQGTVVTVALLQILAAPNGDQAPLLGWFGNGRNRLLSLRFRKRTGLPMLFVVKSTTCSLMSFPRWLVVFLKLT